MFVCLFILVYVHIGIRGRGRGGLAPRIIQIAFFGQKNEKNPSNIRAKSLDF